MKEVGKIILLTYMFFIVFFNGWLYEQFDQLFIASFIIKIWIPIEVDNSEPVVKAGPVHIKTLKINEQYWVQKRNVWVYTQLDAYKYKTSKINHLVYKKIGIWETERSGSHIRKFELSHNNKVKRRHIKKLVKQEIT